MRGGVAQGALRGPPRAARTLWGRRGALCVRVGGCGCVPTADARVPSLVLFREIWVVRLGCGC